MPQGLTQIRRVAIIAALCAIAAIGLQARAALPTTASGVVAGATGQAFADITAAVTGASLVAGIVLFVLLGRYRRKRKRNNQSPATPMPWWARMIAALLALAVIGGPIVLLVRAWYQRGRRVARPVLLPALGHAGQAPAQRHVERLGPVRRDGVRRGGADHRGPVGAQAAPGS